jgi:hypothetical protein
MIDVFGEQFNYEIVRYKDEKSAHLVDVFGMNDGFDSENNDNNFERFYPDDLEKLCYFIKSLTKSYMTKAGANSSDKPSSSAFAAPKTSSFSSFSTKQSSFSKKAGSNSNQNQKNTQVSTQDTLTTTKKYNGKIIVFNSVPECLKIWSPQKNTLINDFNAVLEQMIEETAQREVKSPLFIFTFSDPNEMSRSFLNKLFSHKIMNHHLMQGHVKQF